MRYVRLVASSDAPVLILGETGTGKEMLAREIHARSTRASSSFLRVHCGAIPPRQIDSELFGHDRGSFTGAFLSRRGWFERADGGTLLLAECEELPPAAQVRLLRILQDGRFERVGGDELRGVDVRIIASSHPDLDAMVTDGRFHQDLWHRLAVFPIHIPPLRDRPADIPALAAHFANRAAKRLGLRPVVPSMSDNELLMHHRWPGNVRELAALIERAAILGGGRRLEVSRAFGQSPRPGPSLPLPGQDTATDPERRLQTFDQFVTRHIERALAMAGGRVEGPGGAAALLALNAGTLRSKMRKLGIARLESRATRKERSTAIGEGKVRAIQADDTCRHE